ncbi:MAG: 2'-5' RNA ligase family protein [Clostridia bacterium]|nr:2'-5' RNA ligase family protein [Clostridia bacterium]
MYIWVAIDVSEQLKELRREAERVTEELSFFNAALTLPMHISLRISFWVAEDKVAAVIKRIEEYYAAVSPFEIFPKAVENNGNVVWLSIREHAKLKKIHQDLVDLLLREYAIPLHEFDETFLYHATLFYGREQKTAELAYRRMQNATFPKTVQVNRLLIGCSESGAAGEYRVLKTYELS